MSQKSILIRKLRHGIPADLLLVLVLSICTFLLYADTLDYPFQFDDEITITQNPHLHFEHLSWNIIRNMYKLIYGLRPLSTATFALNYCAGKLDVFGYHLVNITIHILNGIVLFFLIKATFGVLPGKDQAPDTSANTLPETTLIAFFAALIWLVHPLQTNSVTYIVQRMNALACLFYMTAMLFYHYGRKALNEHTSSFRRYRHFPAALFCGLLAFGCKETTYTLPLFILLYELFFFQDLKSKATLRFLASMILFAAAGAILFHIFIGFDFLQRYFQTYYAAFPFTLGQRVLTEFRVVIHYLSLIFFPYPDRLNFDYDFPISHSLTDPITTLFSMIILLGLLLTAIMVAKKERLVAFGILWFLGNLVIESSLIPLDLIFEHRTYLPSIFICVVVVSLLWRILTSVRIKSGLLLTIALILAVWTIQRNAVWSSPVSLWQDCARKSPQKDRVYANLGRAWAQQGDLDKAVHAYRKALALNPYHQYALRNLGLAYYKMGRLEKAIEYYRRAIKSDPNLADAHNDLGVALIDKKQIKEGIAHYREALRLKPDHPDAAANLKKAVQGLEQFNRKIQIALRKLKTEPANVVLHTRLGRLHFLKGDFTKALRYYDLALKTDDTFQPARKGQATVYIYMGRYAKAVRLYKKMLGQHPEDSSIYYNLACVYSRQNMQDKALYWLRQAVEHGFNRPKLLRTDKDLNNIKNTPEFQTIATHLEQ